MALQKAAIAAITFIVAIAAIVILGMITTILDALTEPRSKRRRTAQDFHGSF
jgi:hypothetical protein